MTELIPLRASGPHPTPDEIYRARQAPGDPGSERLLRHAAGCAQCSAEMARQEAFDQPERLPAAALDAAWQRFGRGEPAASPVLGRRHTRWTPALALAATLTACVLGLGIWSLQRGHQESDVVRGGGQETTVSWSPSGLLKAPPAEFVFSGPNDGPRRVRVFDTAQSYEWTSEPTFASRVAFPPEEQRRLNPGVEYLWTVVGRAGEEEATQSFRIGGK
ncbi:MAG TPA: hypothetical protein VGS07_24875 [Thermoanaerobaculia bacterium]|jgi:hypothetical protein|nr:hypothetical protein [Thermoanaerobaculia bacterium]